jgi:hypothetical protein
VVTGRFLKEKKRKKKKKLCNNNLSHDIKVFDVSVTVNEAASIA